MGRPARARGALAMLAAAALSVLLVMPPGLAEESGICPLDCLQAAAQGASECRELFEPGDPLLEDCLLGAALDYWRCLIRCAARLWQDALRR